MYTCLHCSLVLALQKKSINKNTQKTIIANDQIKSLQTIEYHPQVWGAYVNKGANISQKIEKIERKRGNGRKTRWEQNGEGEKGELFEVSVNTIW